MENRYLVALFEHHLWSNLKLIDFCAGLDAAALDQTASGTFGTVRDTLIHVIRNEQHYLSSFPDTGISLTLKPGEPFPGFPALRTAAEATGAAFIQLARTLPAEAMLNVEWQGQTVRLDPAIPLIQAIHHATEHRSQIRLILSQHGITPPDIDGWAYMDALATG